MRGLLLLLRVVQEQWSARSAHGCRRRHHTQGPGHGLVASPQHALLDAGRMDLADQALQRLQAAAEHRGVAQGPARRTNHGGAATQAHGSSSSSASSAVGAEVLWQPMMGLVVVEVVVMVVVMVGETHHVSGSRGGHGGAQRKLQRVGVRVTVRGGEDTVPGRREELPHRELTMHGRAV